MAPPSGSPYARGFAADAETERALRAGLAGREAKVQRGRFAAALKTLVTEPSSQLVFVDLDGAPAPEAAARELAAVCAFGTALIAIGSIDTADFTRALLQHGIADYLVKPISAAAVREACAAAQDDLPERTYAGRVITFAGTAGSGASTLVAAIARGLAAGGRTAVVVDLDPVGGTLSTGLGAKPAGDLTALLATLEPGQRGESDERADPDEPSDFACFADFDPPSIPSSSTAYARRQTPVSRSSRIPRTARCRPRLPRRRSACSSNISPIEHTQCWSRGSSTRRSGPGSCSRPMPGCCSTNRRCPASARRCIAWRCSGTSIPQSWCSAIRGCARAPFRRPRSATHWPNGARTSSFRSSRPLHAAATGEKRLRSPGKAYRKSLRQVAERVIEGPISTAS